MIGIYRYVIQILDRITALGVGFSECLGMKSCLCTCGGISPLGRIIGNHRDASSSNI